MRKKWTNLSKSALILLLVSVLGLVILLYTDEFFSKDSYFGQVTEVFDPEISSGASPPEPPPTTIDITQDIAPAGSQIAGTTSITFTPNPQNPQQGTYSFSFTPLGSSAPTTIYIIDTADTYVPKGMLRIHETVSDSYPTIVAGTSYRKTDGTVIPPYTYANSATTNAFTHSLNNDILTLSYTQSYEGITLQKKYELHLEGKTLILEVLAVNPSSSPTGNYAGVSFDRTESTENPTSFSMPYMEWAPITKFDPGYFMNTYIDILKSRANKISGNINLPYSGSPQTSIYNSHSVVYLAGENNRYEPLDETAYITVSNSVEDLFLTLDASPSPYRQDLNKRVIFDRWNSGYGSVVPGTTLFEKTTNVLTKLNDYGMEDLAVILHIWQNFGYDCGYHTFYPAGSAYGGGTQLQTAINTAKSFGYTIALHENYYQLHQNSPLWDAANIARTPTGALTTGEIETTCPGFEQSYTSAADKRIPLGLYEGTLIKQNYETNAAYIDVSTSTPLDRIDYGATSQSFTLQDVYLHSVALNTQQQEIYQGPVFGEGRSSATSSHILQAGSVDGVEDEISQGASSYLSPNFELKTVKPLMANQGMGYWGRWSALGGPQNTNIDPATFAIDQYRAWQIAYGHTGFIGEATLTSSNPLATIRYAIKEYYTFREVQEQYLSSDMTSVLYKTPTGQMVDLTQALNQNLDLRKSQIQITYANGLTIFVNGHDTETWQVTQGENTYYLPPRGWMFESPINNLLGYSALVDANNNPSPTGTRADFIKSNWYVMADPRGTTINFGEHFGEPVSGTRMIVVKNGELKLEELSDGTFQTTSLTNLAPNSVLLDSGISKFVFNIDPANFGLVSIEDLTTPYVHTLDSQQLAWQTEIIPNTAPFTISTYDSNTAGITKSHTLTTLPDGTQQLDLYWSTIAVGADSFSVHQRWTLAPNSPTAQMTIEVDGTNLQQHSVKSLAPVFYYVNMPTGTKSFFDWREGHLVTDPHTLPGFQMQSGFGFKNEQMGNLYSIFPPNTLSYLHLTINDALGYLMSPRIQGDNSGLRYYFDITGDKQTLPGQSFSPNLYFEIGAVQGAYQQDWWHSAERYKTWLSQQSVYPALLLDRTDYPEYMKNLKYISVITPDVTPVPAGFTQEQAIEALLTAPHAAYGITDSVATFFGYGTNGVTNNLYALSQNFQTLFTTLKSQGVHPTGFVGSAYFFTQDIGYINNPPLATARKKYIDGTPVCGFWSQSGESCLFEPNSPIWQSFQSQSYDLWEPHGLEGFYLDASLKGENFDSSQGYYGGGPHEFQGHIARNNYLHQQQRPSNPDFIIWAEAAFDQLIGSVDLVITKGTSGRFGYEMFFTEQRQKDFDYIPLREFVFSGRTVFGAALDRALAWGVGDYDGPIKAEALGISYGRIITDRPEGYASAYLQPPNGPLTSAEIGFSLFPTTWTAVSTLIYTEVNAFRLSIMSSMDDHMKYTRLGTMMREPQTDSLITEEVFYEISAFNTRVDFPEIPASIWKGPDGSSGIFTINTQNTPKTVTVTIPFTDYGLSSGTSYKVYKRYGNSVSLEGTYSNSFSLIAPLSSYEAATYIIIDPATDLDNDGEGATRWDTNAPWDNCPAIANPNQLDSDDDGYGDACDCQPNNPAINTGTGCGIQHVLDNGQIKLTLIEYQNNFYIESIQNLNTGTTTVFGQRPLWNIALWNPSTQSLIPVDSETVPHTTSLTTSPNSLVLHWNNIQVDVANTFSVTATITLQNDLAYWTAQITPLVNYGIHTFEFPILDIQPFADPTNDIWVTPHGDGHILVNPASDPSAPKTKINPYGTSTQLFALYDRDSKDLFYMATYDSQGYVKDYTLDILPNNVLSFSVLNYGEDGTTPGNSYTSRYPFVMSSFNGDWYDAGKKYREWAVNQPFISRGVITPQNNAYPSSVKFADYKILSSFIDQPGTGYGGVSCQPVTSFNQYNQQLDELQNFFGPDKEPLTHWYRVLGNTMGSYSPGVLPPLPNVAEAVTLAEANSNVKTALYFLPFSWYVNNPSYTGSFYGGQTAQQNAMMTETGSAIILPNTMTCGATTQQFDDAVVDPSQPFAAAYITSLLTDLHEGNGFAAVPFSGIYMDVVGGKASYRDYNPAHSNAANPQTGHTLGGGNYFLQGSVNTLQQVKTALQSIEPDMELMSERQGEDYLPVIDFFNSDVAGIALAGVPGFQVPLFNVIYGGYSLSGSIGYTVPYLQPTTQQSADIYTLAAAITYHYGKLPSLSNWHQQLAMLLPPPQDPLRGFYLFEDKLIDALDEKNARKYILWGQRKRTPSASEETYLLGNPLPSNPQGLSIYLGNLKYFVSPWKAYDGTVGYVTTNSNTNADTRQIDVDFNDLELSGAYRLFRMDTPTNTQINPGQTYSSSFSFSPPLSASSIEVFSLVPVNEDQDADGYVQTPTGDDCNDADVQIHPNAAESCNGADDNCDGQIDEGFTAEQCSFICLNQGGSNYDPLRLLGLQCCGNNPGENNPYETPEQSCDGSDNDCDSQTDEGLTMSFFFDNDNDGYGNPASSVASCTAPPQYVSNNQDCNDNNNQVNPNAPEICNGIDDNCNNQIDEGNVCSPSSYYCDADTDTYDSSTPSGTCSTFNCIPAGCSPTQGNDCDDSNNAVHPGANEVCNNVDDNCDGQIDEGVQTTYYIDQDTDTFGNANIITLACILPTGYVTDNTDCDDNNNLINPAQPENCATLYDDNCDGQINEGCVINQPPSFTNPPPQLTTNEGILFTYQFVASDPENDPLTFYSPNIPLGGILSSSGQLVLNLASAFTAEGIYPIQIEVNDGTTIVPLQLNLEIRDCTALLIGWYNLPPSGPSPTSPLSIVPDGTLVHLNLQTNNCDGVTFHIDIEEDDGILGRDPSPYQPLSVTVQNNGGSVNLNGIYEQDLNNGPGDDAPEYIATAYPLTQTAASPLAISSPILKVIEADADGDSVPDGLDCNDDPVAGIGIGECSGCAVCSDPLGASGTCEAPAQNPCPSITCPIGNYALCGVAGGCLQGQLPTYDLQEPASCSVNGNNGQCTPSQCTPIQCTANPTCISDGDGDGTPDANDLCPQTIGGLPYGQPQPQATEFAGYPETSSFSTDLSIIPLSLQTDFGKIEWLTPISIVPSCVATNLDATVDILSGSVNIDTTLAPELNSAIRITFYDIESFSNPVIMRDGQPCTQCQLVSSANGNLVFTLPSAG